MKECIICREQKNDFNIEHVIPESIEGYYKIKTVCTDCNSNLGSKVDSTVVNHKFIQFQRSMYDISGKSGLIPNPFAGLHHIKDNPDKKIRIELDDEGNTKPYIIPEVPSNIEPNITNNYTMVIDKKDENKINSIIDKLCKRNGILRENLKITNKKVDRSNPQIEVKFNIDIQFFKLGLLKMAYEFATDTIPDYYLDSKALKISNILKNTDHSSLNDSTILLGSGFDTSIFKPFEFLIDFNDKNHYLILIDDDQVGLMCLIRLYNIFSIGINLSKKPGYIENKFLFGINDSTKRTFKILSFHEVFNSTYSKNCYTFQFIVPPQELIQFHSIQNSQQFEFYKENGQIPLYDENGIIKYPNFEDKIFQPQLQQTQSGDVINSIISVIILDEILFLKLLPGEKYYRVRSVRLEQKNQHTLDSQ